MRRLGPTLLALTLAATTLVAVSYVAPAGAVVKGTTCTKATFKTNLATFKSTSVISGCTNPAATKGQGTLVANFKNLNKITAKITWKAGGTSSYTVTQKKGPSTNKCKGTGANKDILIVSTGKYTGGTGKAVPFFKGTVYTEKLCVTKKNATYLLPGSKIVFK